MRINCKNIVGDIKKSIEEELATLRGQTPHLVTIQVGNNPESNIYVNKKKETLEAIGLLNTVYKLDEDTTEEFLLGLLKDLAFDDTVTGILVQLPLPKHINVNKVIAAIPPDKDIDGFTALNLGKMFLGQECITPCTPKGVLEIIDYLGYNLVGAKVLIIGRSNILGKPLQTMLTNRSAVVLTLHSKVKQPLKDIITEFNPNIIISCVGQVDLFSAETIMDNSDLDIIIDCAINRGADGLRGDFKKEDCSYLEAREISYTPVPGGVGVMTTTMVAKNLVECHKLQNGGLDNVRY